MKSLETPLLSSEGVYIKGKVLGVLMSNIVEGFYTPHMSRMSPLRKKPKIFFTTECWRLTTSGSTSNCSIFPTRKRQPRLHFFYST